jgi:hypothetical protein
MGFGLQGRSAGRPPHFSFSAVAQATAASYHAFSRPSLFISPPCARFVSPRSFAFGGPRTESDIMATGLGDALPPYP